MHCIFHFECVRYYHIIVCQIRENSIWLEICYARKSMANRKQHEKCRKEEEHKVGKIIQKDKREHIRIPYSFGRIQPADKRQREERTHIHTHEHM